MSEPVKRDEKFMFEHKQVNIISIHKKKLYAEVHKSRRIVSIEKCLPLTFWKTKKKLLDMEK